jgi:hypothetical protein
VSTRIWGILGFWLGTTKCNQEAAFQVLPGPHQSVFGRGGGVRVSHLFNTRWFHVLETKIPATKEPLGSGYFEKALESKYHWVS